MNGVVISYDTIGAVLGFIVQLGVLVATLAVWGSKIDSRLKVVEGHGEKVDKINTLEASFDGFKSEIERRLSGMERKVDDVHTLLLRAASRAG